MLAPGVAAPGGPKRTAIRRRTLPLWRLRLAPIESLWQHSDQLEWENADALDSFVCRHFVFRRRIYGKDAGIARPWVGAGIRLPVWLSVRFRRRACRLDRPPGRRPAHRQGHQCPAREHAQTGCDTVAEHAVGEQRLVRRNQVAVYASGADATRRGATRPKVRRSKKRGRIPEHPAPFAGVRCTFYLIWLLSHAAISTSFVSRRNNVPMISVITAMITVYH